VASHRLSHPKSIYPSRFPPWLPPRRRGPDRRAFRSVSTPQCQPAVSLQQYELSLIIVYSHSPQIHMARKVRTSPRKSASQERSRLTVNAILEATARVLMKEGYDRASTNKI